jgi:hypothetical protein
MPELDHIQASLTAVASFGLEDGGAAIAEPIEDDQWAELLRSLEAHRVLGLLGAAVEAGRFPVTEPQRAALELELQRWHAHALRLERLVLDAVAVFARAGIRHRVLKGMALSHTAYPAPEWRVFGDADVLVEPSALGAATNAFAAALGGIRVQPKLCPGFDDRFGKEVLVRVGELELDLHRTFVEGALGLTIELEDLWSDATRFEISGVALDALTPTTQVMHAAYAVAVGDEHPRLCAQRDLAQLLLFADIVQGSVLDLARRWRAEALLAWAIRTAWDSLRLTAEPSLLAWARSHRATRREEWLLASHRGRARGYTRHLTALGVLPSWSAKGAYLRAIAWPSGAYLRARGSSRRAFLMRPIGATRELRN